MTRGFNCNTFSPVTKCKSKEVTGIFEKCHDAMLYCDVTMLFVASRSCWLRHDVVGYVMMLLYFQDGIVIRNFPNF